MTNREIFDAYVEREKAANQTPQGADHKAILAEVAQEAKKTVAEVRAIILDSTFMGPN